MPQKHHKLAGSDANYRTQQANKGHRSKELRRRRRRNWLAKLSRRANRGSR